MVVRTVKETPPAELLRCPVLARGLPTSGEAVIPPAWRAGITDLARVYAATRDHLDRLIRFNGGEGCGQA